MAVGLPLKTTYADGDVYSASDVNDTNGTVNLVGQTNNFYAGKNKIINGDFGIWQRGTSFSNPANATYTADRWFVELDGTGSTRTISQQTFTPGTAPVSGYNGTFFYRWNTSVAGTGNTIQALSTRLEDIRTFAGQTVTFSFWGKADASRALTVYAYQQSTGGSGTVTTTVGTATLTTSWARYTMSVAIPSLTGITIGTNSNLQLRIAMPTGVTMTCDFWGMQLESGSTATAFQTATGSVPNELAACQRYFEKSYNVQTALGTVDDTTATWGSANAGDTTLVNGTVYFKVTKRTNPTIVIYNTDTGASGSFVAAGSTMTVSTTVPGQMGIGRVYATTGMIANTYVRFHWTASAEL
jgi:hypothetical protein